MPGRPPTQAVMPSTLTLSITLPPNSKEPVNALILLHGLGDTSANFTQLGKSMQLPETTCIALQGPSALPQQIGGYHWGDNIAQNPINGSIELDAGFRKSVNTIVGQIIRSSLIQSSGFQPRDVLLFGYGQGGMAALAVATAMDEELGGGISVGGCLPADARRPFGSKSRTPVLVLGGSSESQLTAPAVEILRQNFDDVEIVRWDKPNDGMPASRAEMLPIMQFFSRRLRSNAGVPRGAVPIN